MGILQPVFRPLFSPIMRRTFRDGASGGASAPSLTAQVQALFAKYSAAGGMWDFTDMATLFQDSGGTTPVTAASQPVGRVLDQSGQGNHFIQTTAGKRPAYNGAGITPDGVDDSMVTAANLNLTACDKLVVAMGYTKVDDSLLMQVELSANINANPGTFFLLSGADGPHYQTTRARGASAAYVPANFASALGNEYGAHIGRHSITGDLSEVWWNGTKGVDSTEEKGTGNSVAYPLYLLSRAGTSLHSNTPARRAIVLAPIVAAPQVSDDDVELIRLWLMEGVESSNTFNVTDNGGEPFGVTEGNFLVED